MTKNGDAVLVDLDGTLVDNLAFEKLVTRVIISHIAELRSIPIALATQLWEESLFHERNSLQWYDYDYHCSKLGVPSLSMKAHQKALGHLHEVTGARTTWNVLAEHFAGIYVVSEAPTWVMRLKLATLGFRGYVDLLSSQDIGAPKSSAAFWLQLKPAVLRYSPSFLVDNKACNLAGASMVMGKLTYVLFDRREHSMTLPERIRPANSIKCSAPLNHYLVHSHSELQQLIRNRFGATQDGKRRETCIPA